MNVLYGWSAKRAGGHITIKHSTGRVTHVDQIRFAESGELVAVTVDNRVFILSDKPVTPREG